MTRRKTPASDASVPDDAPPDAEREDFVGGRSLTRKQLAEMIRRKESLHHVDLRSADLSGMVFDGLDLSWAKFGEANLTRCSFRNATLVGASFFGATLKDAVFDGADLEDADLDYAWLDGVSLKDAKVRKAIFPLRRVSMDTIRESVRTGKRLAMERIPLDDDDG